MSKKRLGFSFIALLLSCLIILSVISFAPCIELAHSLDAGQSPSKAPQIIAGADPTMAYGNAQRSSVLSTRGLNEVPRQVLWKSMKLFEYRDPNADEAAILKFIGGTILETITVPIISKGIIFFAFRQENAYLYALDASTGRELGVLKREKTFVSSPAAIGGDVLFGDRNGAYAFDIERRVQKWAFERKGLSFSGCVPIIDDGVVYMYGGGVGGGLYAFAVDTGELRWTFNSQSLDGPAISGSEVILVNPRGLLLSLDKRTGTKRWEAKIVSDASAPAILDDQIFLSTKSGEIRAYGLGDGSLRWQSKKSGGTGTALALFKGRVIYGGRENSIIALDASSGLESWKFRTSLRCRNPIIAGDLLYTVCNDHKLYALDPSTGDEKWRLDNQRATLPPIFADGVMYVLGTDGFLSALK